MPSFRRESESRPAAPSAALEDLDALRSIAHGHLDADVATRWLSMLRPAVRLHASDTADAVARIGGRPVVPDDFAWPVWQGVGPLAYVGELDLEALESRGLDTDVALPRTGRLLVFYFDGSYDDFTSIVGTWDRESLQGARLIHVAAAREECTQAPTPEGVLEFPEQRLCGRQIMTHPGWEHHALRAAFGAADWDFETWREHPVQGEAFNEALFALDEGDTPRHQVGGWADPVQGPVEFEVAQAAIPEEVEYGSSAHVREAFAWRPLLQIDSDHDSDMMWGDVGTLYWLLRDPQQPTSELGPVSFTWQCG